MAIDKIQASSINLADTFAFTGSVTGAGGGITMADQWRLTSDKTGLSGQQDITANLSQVSGGGFNNIGSSMTESSGVFSFPITGIYLITFQAFFERSSGSANYMAINILTTTDNSSFGSRSEGGETLRDDPSSMGSISISFIFDVENVSTHKCKFKTDVSDAQTLKGASSANKTCFTFIRLGDT
jgi:hypothetical protein